MRHFFFTTSFVFTTLCGYSQNTHTIDSLLHILTTDQDSSKVSILLDLSRELRYSNTPRALAYCMEGLELATQLDNLPGITRAQEIAGMLNTIQGNHERAIEFSLKALSGYEVLDKKNGVGNLYNGLAIIHRQQKNYERSLAYNFKSLSIRQELQDSAGIAGSLGNIGLVYFNMEKYDSSLHYHLASLAIDQKRNHLQGLAITYNNIGLVYQYQDKTEEALEYFQRSLTMEEELDNQRGIAISCNTIAEIYLQRGWYEEAIVYASRALTIGQAYSLKMHTTEALKNLSDIYAAMGNYQQAYEHQLLHKAVRDSIFNEEQTQQIAEMEARFDLEKKEQQITAQQQQIALMELNEVTAQRLRIALIAVAILLVFLVGFVYNRYRIKQKAEQLLNQKNLEISTKNEEIARMNLELEKKMLRAQMDPHFIFNSLNSIQHFITINDKKSALKYLSLFSRLVRQILENSINHQVPVVDEVKLLEYYLELESLRFDHQFSYCIDIDESLDIYNIEIPFLLLQPYVENAIVHGLRHTEEGGKVHVKILHDQDHMRCIIEDNGIGRQAAAKQKEGSITHHRSRGMSVTTQRLEILNRSKRHKTHAKITDLYDAGQHPAGTRVELFIPII